MRTHFLRTFRGLLVVAMLLLLFSASTVVAGTRPQPTAQVSRTEASATEEVVLGDLPGITAADVAGAKEAPFPRNPHFTDAEYQAAKLAASKATVGSRPQDAAHLLVPRIQGRTPTSGAFIDFFGQSEGCNGLAWRPSDMGLAVGPNNVVQVVNECIAVYTKAGALVTGYPKDLCRLMHRVPNSGTHGCFDPRATYDWRGKRFIVISSFQSSSGNAFLDLAVSQTGSATGSYSVYHFFRGVGLADYPTLGQTAYSIGGDNANNAVITICDNFSGASFSAECLFIPKGTIGTAGTGAYAPPIPSIPVVFGFTLGGLALDTLQPVNVYELEENPKAQYAVDSVNFDGGDGFCTPAGTDSGLVMWSFSDATGTQGIKFSGLYTGCNTTSPYFFPGAADNASFCSACIETIDNRITGMVHYASGRFYPSIDANNGGTSAVLGWTVRPFLNDNGGGCTGGVNCPTLTGTTIEQEWCYACGGGNTAEAYFGAQAPTPHNDWTMFATFSSSGSGFNISPGQFYTSNRVSWLTPFHDAGIFSCVNNAAYTQFRWGDYAAAAVDIPGGHKDPATWGSGMYVQKNSNWGTCIAANQPGQ
jgi:hypothetical protein